MRIILRRLTFGSSLPVLEYPHLAICMPTHIEVRDVQNGKVVQVVRGVGFRCLFEDNQPSRSSSGGKNPNVIVSGSRVTSLQRGTLSDETV